MQAGKKSVPATLADPGRQLGKASTGLRANLYTILFEARIRAGRLLDLALIFAIVASVLVMVLDSVQAVSSRHSNVLGALEWFFTLVFTAEYLSRLYSARHPLRYATSFSGIIDFLSALPIYLALMLPGAQILLGVRILRLLRILKLTPCAEEYGMLSRVLLASRHKVLTFISEVMISVLPATLMYVEKGRATDSPVFPPRPCARLLQSPQ